MLYRIAPDTIDDSLGYLNFPELFLLPSQNELFKNKGSLLHNKFMFIKSLMQAILLYTVEHLDASKIPAQIRSRLGIINIMDLFTLSVFSHNKVGILLDTSSNNSSVHRVFSMHPTTGLVTIPLLDPKTRAIHESYKSISQLKEKAKPEHVLEQLNAQNTGQYYQFPPVITSKELHYMLRPTILLPTISVIVRFSDRWITERNAWSYSFWLQMYELNTFYDYIMALLLNVEREQSTIGEVYKHLLEIIDQSAIRGRIHVKEVINQYFFQHASYKSLQSKLNAFRDIEFFARFKREELRPLSVKQMERLFNGMQLRTFFFRKFLSFFNIALVILGYYLPNLRSPDPRLRGALIHFHSALEGLKSSIVHARVSEDETPSGYLKLHFTQICCVYNYIVGFFNELFGETPFPLEVFVQ